jgi:hypothetical protein
MFAISGFWALPLLLQKDVRKQLYGDADDKVFFEGLKVSTRCIFAVA